MWTEEDLMQARESLRKTLCDATGHDVVIEWMYAGTDPLSRTDLSTRIDRISWGGEERASYLGARDGLGDGPGAAYLLWACEQYLLDTLEPLKKLDGEPELPPRAARAVTDAVSRYSKP